MTEIGWQNLGSTFTAGPAAVTIGVFDGLHEGHRALISRVVETPWMPVVVTFQRHPSEILLHDSIPGFIMSLGQKRAALREAGVEVSVLVDFNDAFRQTPGVDFLTALRDAFDLRRLVVGHDFRCGHLLDTGIDEIREFFSGTATEIVDVGPVVREASPVSSTRIRGSILSGDLDEAERLLGRPYTLDISDEAIGLDNGRAYIVKDRRGLLPESRQLLPPRGEYDALLGTSPDPATCEAETVVEIGENSLSWPLVARESIHYIVMKDRRITSKE